MARTQTAIVLEIENPAGAAGHIQRHPVLSSGLTPKKPSCFVGVTVFILLLLASKDSLSRPQAGRDQPVGTARTEEEFLSYQELFQPLSPTEIAGKAEEFLKRHPQSGLRAFVHQAAFLAYSELKDFGKLVAHGEAVLIDLPENSVVLTALAQTYAELNKPEDAISRATSALRSIEKLEARESAEPAAVRLELRRLKAQNYASLGTVHLQNVLSDKKRIDQAEKRESVHAEAIANFEKALFLDPEDALSSYRLAMAFALKNDSANAICYYARAAALTGPVASVARSNLTKILTVLGRNPDEAAQLIEKARVDIRKRMEGLRVKGASVP